MKIAYIDLTFTDFFEHYSIAPSRYGGGRVFASWLKQFPEFFIFAPKQCFNPAASQDDFRNCIPISRDQQSKLAAGQPVADVLPGASSFDLFVHLDPNTHLNLSGLKAKELVWLAGVEQKVNPLIENLALYNDFQKPLLASNPKMFRFQLGYPIPFFKNVKKEDYIFQCSRHVSVFSSLEIASFCQRNGIRGIFAGPIAHGYPLLDVIDGKTTTYLGEIPESLKLDLLRAARLCTLVHNWPAPFSLSAVESLSCGTPVACVPTGFWPTLIKHGVNGFFVESEETLMHAWNEAPKISAAECYVSALPHNLNSMVESVWSMFRQVVNP